MDPLVGAVCTPPEIWQMVDEMLVAGAAWLPQYADAIAAAQARLAHGKTIPTRTGYAGAARLHTKTIDEMRADRASSQRNAEATDKAKLRPAAAKQAG
jgi:alpha-galactosidase